MKKVKLLNYLLIIGMLIGDVVLVINDLRIDKTDRLATYIILIPILLAPYLLKKLFHYELSEELKLVYYIFIFLAQFLGSGVNLYNKTKWFDKFTHLLSGTLTSFVGVILLKEFKKDQNKNILFHSIFILGIVMTIAGIWEFFEFGMDRITGSNLQHVIETGVGDSMGDMISAFLGYLLFIVYYVYEMKYKVTGFMHNFIAYLK